MNNDATCVNNDAKCVNNDAKCVNNDAKCVKGTHDVVHVIPLFITRKSVLIQICTTSRAHKGQYCNFIFQYFKITIRFEFMKFKNSVGNCRKQIDISKYKY